MSYFKAAVCCLGLRKLIKCFLKCELIETGVDLGGGGGGGFAFFQGFDPLPTRSVPLWYFLRNPFLADRP